ncbi:MAG: dienelactone hydrolase family protein [Alphaproteobacteria bacterium]
MIAAALAALLLALPAAATAASLVDGRSGRIEFESATPAGPTALIEGSGAPATVAGLLRLPPGSGRVPAMVIAHGSGGITDGREHAWADRLIGWGVATFVVDSFGPRGIASTGADQSRLATVANTADALHALRLLASHPRIDPRRIGVMGFSRGGQVALYAALEPFRRAILPAGERFALHVAFYASCSLPYIADAVAPSPILMLLGGADDYTPAAHCGRYADWFRSKGAPVERIVIDGAHHGFDVPSPPRTMASVQTARRCGLDIMLSPVQGRRWSDGEIVPADRIGAYIRGCMERGATFGGDPRARAAAEDHLRRAVEAHLRPGS